MLGNAKLQGNYQRRLGKISPLFLITGRDFSFSSLVPYQVIRNDPPTLFVEQFCLSLTILNHFTYLHIYLAVVNISSWPVKSIRAVALAIWFTTVHITHFLEHSRTSGILAELMELNGVVFEIPT